MSPERGIWASAEARLVGTQPGERFGELAGKRRIFFLAG